MTTALLLGMKQVLPIVDLTKARIYLAEQSPPAQRKLDCAALDVPFPNAVVGALNRQRVAILQLAHTLLQRLMAGFLLRKSRFVVLHPVPQSIYPGGQFAQCPRRGTDWRAREAVVGQFLCCSEESAQRAQNEHLHIGRRDAQ